MAERTGRTAFDHPGNYTAACCPALFVKTKLTLPREVLSNFNNARTQKINTLCQPVLSLSPVAETKQKFK